MLKKITPFAITLMLLSVANAQAPPGGANPEMEKARAEMRAACAADIKTYCAAVEGPVGACLREHEDKLAQECKTSLAKMPHPPAR